MMPLIVAVYLMTVGLASAPTPAVIGRINFLLGKSGDVSVHHSASTNWIPAKYKMSVFAGDQIKTEAESRCEVKLSDGSVIRIGEESLFDFEKANLAENKRQFSGTLKRGSIWATIKKLLWGKQESFAIKSPTAVCAVRGTIYRMDADSTTRVAVYDGQVDVGPADSLLKKLRQRVPQPGPPREVPGPTEVPGPFEVSLEQWVRLVQGYQIEIRADGKYARSKIDEERERDNEWIQWNRGRDRQWLEQE